MPEMGRYCKAYLAKQFREFTGWEENLQNLRVEKKTANDAETEIKRTELHDNDVLYLQENYVVTDDIFKDEHIVFDKVNEEWKTFCQQVLKFEIPTFQTTEIEESNR